MMQCSAILSARAGHCLVGGAGAEHPVEEVWRAEDMCALARCSARAGQMFVSYTT